MFPTAVDAIVNGIEQSQWWKQALKNGTPRAPPSASPFPTDEGDRVSLARQVVLNDLLADTGSLTLEGGDDARCRLLQLHMIAAGCVAPPVTNRFIAVHSAVGEVIRLKVHTAPPVFFLTFSCVFSSDDRTAG